MAAEDNTRSEGLAASEAVIHGSVLGSMADCGSLEVDLALLAVLRSLIPMGVVSDRTGPRGVLTFGADVFNGFGFEFNGPGCELKGFGCEFNGSGCESVAGVLGALTASLPLRLARFRSVRFGSGVVGRGGAADRCWRPSSTQSAGVGGIGPSLVREAMGRLGMGDRIADAFADEVPAGRSRVLFKL